MEDRLIEFEIEPGIPIGHVYKFPGEGEPHSEGESGDLIFVLKQLRWGPNLNFPSKGYCFC